MTNGEKLCIDFPNMRIKVFTSYVQVMGENYEFNNSYPLEWWNAEYIEPTTQERQAESDKFDAAFQDGYNNGYAQARFDYEKEPTTKNDLGVSCGLEKTRNVNPIIDWNNCHTSNQLNSISIPKNDLAVDCISRADARSLICKIDIKHHMSGMSRKAFKDLYNGMDELPSVTPQEPKTGYWILTDVEGNKVWHCNCSECGKDPQDYIGGSENWWLIKSKLPKFCPSCGSDNREVKE